VDLELPTIKYEFNKQNFIVRLVFNYCDFAFSFVLSSFLLHCTHVQMSLCIKCLLTYTCNLYNSPWARADFGTMQGGKTSMLLFHCLHQQK